LLTHCFSVEEQKYLRQIYKKQLTSETIMEKADSKHVPLARLFRGVADDRERRGELFGYSNLLRFEETTLGRYNTDPGETRKYGIDVYTDRNILASLESLTEESMVSLFDDSEMAVEDMALTTSGKCFLFQLLKMESLFLSYVFLPLLIENCLIFMFQGQWMVLDVIQEILVEIVKLSWICIKN
jgi:hypothetical protein